jgi:hypothetical protein
MITEYLSNEKLSILCGTDLIAAGAEHGPVNREVSIPGRLFARTTRCSTRPCFSRSF